VLANGVRARDGAAIQGERKGMTEIAMMTTERHSAPAPQRMRALERANAVRLARAELKRRIAHGHLSAAEVILQLPAEATTWPVGELLMSQRRWGSNRTRKLLSGLQISEMRHLGMLTERQRRVLAAQLGATAIHELPLNGYVDRYRVGSREQEEPHGEPGHSHSGADDQYRFQHEVARVVEPPRFPVGAVDVA
jgi:hypothetical protein